MKKNLHSLLNNTPVLSWKLFNTPIRLSLFYQAALVLAFMATVTVGKAQIIAFPTTWTGTPSTVNATTVVANITAPVTCSRGVGLTAASSGSRFNSTGFPTSATLTPSSSTGYLTFTITAASGYVLNLNGATINLGIGSSSTGPTKYAIYSSVAGYTSTANQISADLAVTAGSTASPSVVFPSSGYDGLSAITLRLYAWGGTATGGTGGFGSFSVGGTAAVVAVGPSLNVSLNTLSFSNTNVGSSSSSSTFNLSGANLTGAPGTITVNAPSNFEVSNNNSAWGATTTIAYSTATFAATPVYVRFSPQTAGAKTGNITFTGAGGVSTPPTVALTGTGVAPALATPVATTATAINSTGFTANWNAVAGATGYFLDVSTSSTFGAGGTATISEEFDAAPTAPSGWTFTGVSAYLSNSAGYYGNSANSLKFTVTGHQVVSPTALGTVTELKFWMRGANITGASALLVEGYNGSSWVTVQNITPISNVAATMIYNASTSPALPSNLTQFRFTYTKGGGNLAFDDYTITYNSSTPFFIPGYNNKAISGTSEVLTGLDPLTTYYYRVRATNGTATGNSNTISVTTSCIPLAEVTPPGATSVCAGTNTLFFASFGTYNPPTLRWQVNPGTGWEDVVLGAVYSINPGDGPEFLNISNVPASYNGYQYRLVANNGCDNFSSAATLTVNPTPATPSITGASGVCMGSSLPLTGSATAGTYSWLSNMAGVATVNLSNGLVSPVMQGTTTITYRITENGCNSEATKVVTVNALPATPSITGANTVCMGASLTLTGSSTSGTAAWTSNATGVATVSGGVVTPVTAGSTTITYTITENGCSSATTKAITVNAAPATPMITGASAVCMGASLTLTGSSTTGTATWTSNTTGVATVSGGVVTPVSAGSTTITYTVTENGCSSAITQAVTVNDLPATPMITGASAVCMGASLTLTGSSTAGTAAWTSNATGVATVSGGVVTPVMAGSTTITYTITENGCSSAITQAVTVNDLPATPTITGASAVCMGASLTLTGSSTTGTATWTSNTTGVATVSGGVVTPVSAGSTTITYTVTENGCSNAATKAITVNDLPATPTITGASAVCMGASLSLTGSATSGMSAWLTSAAGVATVNASGLVSPVSAGTSTITYQVTESGCSNETTKLVTVNIIPTLVITNPTAVCAPATVDFTASAVTAGSSAGATFSYYSTANGFVVHSNPSMVASTGNAYIKATLNGCSTSSPYSQVTSTVNAAPHIAAPADMTICPGSSINLTATTNNGSTYGWSNGATTILASPAVTTTYTVTATLGSCTASDDVVVSVSSPSLTGGSAMNMSIQCEDGNWSYYGNASSNLFFGIEWGASNGTAKNDARVDITINPAMYSQEAGSEATYVMKRSWDVHHQAGGAVTLAAPVNIRFFYDTAEKTAVTTATAAFLAAHPGTEKPFAWFKTNDGTGAFDAGSMLAAAGLTGCYILSSATESTMNGVAYVEITGVTGFSGGSAGAGVGAASILPVTLASFRATKKEQSVELQWKTASEQNAKQFVVEKSTDGIHFKALTEVAAVGTSKVAQTYTQLDKNPSQGDNYYRLLLKDNDGSSRYIGKIVKVNFSNANSFTSIYPNPVSEELTVQTSQAEAAKLQLRILDISGQLIQTIDYDVEEGNNSKILDVHALRGGTYLLQVVNENQEQISVSRFVKM